MNKQNFALDVIRFHEIKASGIATNRVTLSRWIAAGNFPKPIRLGPNSIAWRMADIEAWLASRAAVTGVKANADKTPNQSGGA